MEQGIGIAGRRFVLPMIWVAFKNCPECQRGKTEKDDERAII
jgi:hypothetical protein